MATVTDWAELVDAPANAHFAQVYQDAGFLAEAVTRYLQAGVDRGEAALVIARPEHRARFQVDGEVVMLDAESTLAECMTDGMPQWDAFYQRIGGLVAELRRRYPAVRAYGEMVDLLWQRGEHEAAIRLEEYWNDLGKLEAFSLFCAYAMDPLDSGSYGGPLEAVCKAHSHLIPARDYAAFDTAVSDASRKVLDPSLARMLLSVSASQPGATQMPLGQATLMWLRQNMPRAADRVLSEVRASASRAA